MQDFRLCIMMPSWVILPYGHSRQKCCYRTVECTPRPIELRGLVRSSYAARRAVLDRGMGMFRFLRAARPVRALSQPIIFGRSLSGFQAIGEFGSIMMALGDFLLCFGGQPAKPFSKIDGRQFAVAFFWSAVPSNVIVLLSVAARSSRERRFSGRDWRPR